MPSAWFSAALCFQISAAISSSGSLKMRSWLQVWFSISKPRSKAHRRSSSAMPDLPRFSPTGNSVSFAPLPSATETMVFRFSS